MKLKKRDWLVIIIALATPWVFDFILKRSALSLPESGLHYGPFHLELYFNKGIILGSFQDISSFLLQVCLTTFGAFLLFIYAFLQYFMGVHSFNFRVGLSFLASGILGNITDRLLYQKVIDFMWIDFGFVKTGVFNLADFIQWVGCFFILIGIWKHRDLFWPKKESRGNIWVQSSFQIRYIMTFILINIGFSLISGIFFFAYFQVMLKQYFQESLKLSAFFPFLITYVIITLQFCVALWIICRALSHRMAGPLYAFEKFVDNLAKGKPVKNFKLRSTDEFTHLEDVAKKVQAMVKERNNST